MTRHLARLIPEAKLCVSTGSAGFSESPSSAVRQPAFDRPEIFSKE